MPLPLETERLRLREATLADLGVWHEIAHDAERAWFGEPQATLDESRAKLELRIAHQERHGFSLWPVELKASGEVVGLAGLVHLEDGPEIEVGYRFLEPHWGNGYATEAARAAIAFGFDELRLDRIVAVTLPDNYGSRRVLEKCGLTLVGPTFAYGYPHVKYAIERN
ncbi:MAG TPA: GNAT family N-acetyltransferase [Gaiellaceae bacterium]|nr:GNAT family N-acetyltransferase [Gaiellaceae bacterium]